MKRIDCGKTMLRYIWADLTEIIPYDKKKWLLSVSLILNEWLRWSIKSLSLYKSLSFYISIENKLFSGINFICLTLPTCAIQVYCYAMAIAEKKYEWTRQRQRLCLLCSGVF